MTPSVTGSFVNEEKPYAVQGPWLQVLLPMELAERMIHELQVLSNPEQVSLKNQKEFQKFKQLKSNLYFSKFIACLTSNVHMERIQSHDHRG